ncbi:MAG: hypothetical protein HZT40_17035 [Candidatus Thiothrix singaporensis]|uniref:PPM-type phosphatase domain-containing protein n=1 Tax=Candidatus Thiothrix singaporensis TaxID=2799669 RepID=A0A7L6AV47_9GAMM|nr:MAG: hypothetical protein HZT40_17035 [Candidatus Thiothrix singaporensis]
MKINAEHTVRERFKRLLEGGKISQAEFEAVEEPHALTSALKPDKLHEIDGNQRVFHKGEVLILASDGLLGLEQPEIHALIDRQVSAQVLADRLLRATLEKRRAGQDNIGIIVIKQPQRQMFTRSSLLVVLGECCCWEPVPLWCTRFIRAGKWPNRSG